MNALAAMSTRDLEQSASQDAVTPSVAVVTPCKATYFKPLYEAFANAQPKPWRTVMIWPDSHDSEHPDELITPVADNLEIRRVDSRKVVPSQNPLLNRNWRERRRRFFPSAELWSTLREVSPRAVLIQEYSPFALSGLFYARWKRIPVFTLTEVGQRNQQFFNSRTRLWHGLWSRLVDGIVAACPTAHVPVSGITLPSIAAYHAVDSRLYTPASHRQDGAPVTYIYVGQLIPRKGLDLWIKAASELKSRVGATFKLRFVGGGDEGWVRGLVENAGLTEQVEWAGFLSGNALRESIRSADVFVLPSRQDTYAVVVHEAACLGLPLIISKHAGAAEGIVRDGVNGYVIDPENTTSFSGAMQSMMDEHHRQKLGIAARTVGEAMSAHQRGAELWRWMASNFLSATK